MVRIKAFWNRFKNFAILFSFLINFILLIVLLVVVLLIFQIKSGIAQPLINGLHGAFVGLDEARIITQINVSDTVPVKLTIPLKQNTTVVLTNDVALTANATFTLPGGGGNIRGSVAIVLPRGLQLPVALDLTVPIDSTLPIDLKVPVDIPLKQTQLHDVADQLRSLFDPFVRILGNLPDDWNGFWVLVGQILGGKGPDLMAPNKYILYPWPGFRTGLGPNAGTPGTPTPALIFGTPKPGDVFVPTPGPESPGQVFPVTPGGAITPASGTGGPTPTLTIITGPGQPTPTPTRVSDLGIITPTPRP